MSSRAGFLLGGIVVVLAVASAIWLRTAPSGLRDAGGENSSAPGSGPTGGDSPEPELPADVDRSAASRTAGAPTREDDRELPEVVEDPRGAVVEGRLGTEAGVVAGASVTLTPIDHSAAARRTLSGEDGHFQLRGVPPGEWLLRAWKGREGHRHPVLQLLAEEHRDLGRLWLQGGQELSVQVVDETGAPVVDATVDWYGEAAERSARTDAAGVAPVGFVADGHYNVDVHHARFVGPGPLAVSVPSPEGIFTVTMQHAASLVGTVVDAGGRPIEGVELSLQAEGFGDATRARSDAHGRFALAVPSDQGLVLRAEAAGYQVLDLEELRAGNEELRLVLQSGARWRARVVSAVDGGAVSVLRCTAWSLSRRGTERRVDELRVEQPTPSDLELVFSRERGAHRVCIEAEGHAPWWSPVFELGAEDAVQLVELSPGHALEVQVRDARTGEPLPGANVVLRRGSRPDPADDQAWLTAAWARAREPMEWRAAARTDERGEARFEQLPAGASWLQLTAPGGWASTRREVAVGDQPRVEIELSRGAMLHGVVADADGDPWSGRLLLASDELLILERHSDSTGRYEFEGLPPGRYCLLPQPEGRGQIIPTGRNWLLCSEQGNATRQRLDDDNPYDVWIELGTDPIRHDLVVHTRPSGVLEGVVRIDGQPRSGLLVRWIWQGFAGNELPRLHPSAGSTRTDARGRFRFDEAYGPVRLDVRSDDLRILHLVHGVSLRPDEPQWLEVDAFSSRLSLRVRRPEGSEDVEPRGWIERERVHGGPRGPESRRRFSLIPQADGSLELDGLRPGPYGWRVWARGTQAAWGEVVLVAGQVVEQTVELVPGSWIRARLHFPDRSAPPRFVRYHLSSTSELGNAHWEGSAERGEDGQYWIATAGMVSPDARLRVWCDGAEMDSAEHRAETRLALEEGRVAVVELELLDG